MFKPFSNRFFSPSVLRLRRFCRPQRSNKPSPNAARCSAGGTMKSPSPCPTRRKTSVRFRNKGIRLPAWDCPSRGPVRSCRCPPRRWSAEGFLALRRRQHRRITGAARFHALVGVVMIVHIGLATLLATTPRKEGILGRMRLSPHIPIPTEETPTIAGSGRCSTNRPRSLHRCPSRTAHPATPDFCRLLKPDRDELNPLFEDRHPPARHQRLQRKRLGKFGPRRSVAPPCMVLCGGGG